MKRGHCAQRNKETRTPDAPVIRRTYLILTGHAVDLLAREAKFPAELEARLGGNLIFAKTDIFSQLVELKKRFSATLDTSALYIHGNGEGHDAELRKLKAKKVIAPAAGNRETELTFAAGSIPAEFFRQGRWHFGGAALLASLTSNACAPFGSSTRT